MTPKSGPPSEILEPLQSFLESFTQELTEQQFIPAFREELRSVVSAIDNLQQSEESLQQIARGVERLREVFAPAGTRMLEGVKELETAMRANAADLRDRSTEVLKDLLNTHDQLESALRNEAGIIQEQTSASREALTRTVADVEQRLQTLTGTLDTLCRKMEEETVSVSARSVREAGEAPLTASFSVPGQPVAPVHGTEEVRSLLARTEATVNAELERQRTVLLGALQQSTQQYEERLAKVDQTVQRSVSSVAPRVQEDLEQALLRLEERLQSRIISLPGSNLSDSGGDSPSVAPEAVTGAVASVENRLVNEIAALRKTLRGDHEEAAKAAQELAKEFEETTRRYMTRVTEETNQVNASLAGLNKLAESLSTEERETRDELARINTAIQSITGTFGERASEESRETLELLRSQAEVLTRKVDEDRHLLGQLAAAISRAEQAATTATERSHAESRTLREKIDGALKEVADRMQRDVVTETDRVQDTLKQLAQAWQSELSVLREDISQLTKDAGNTFAAGLRQIQSQMEDGRRADQGTHKELQAELNRTASTLDERVANLQSASDSVAKELQSHVKAVSNEVAKARTSQEQSLAVLKEAIRANYDEGANRLREVIDGGYDNFVKQIATIPQALERYASLIQSLNQGSQLALQSISTDAKNMLNLATDKFEVLVTDSTATKKFYPLLDRKIERHTAELDAIRKMQGRHEKELNEIKSSVSDLGQRTEVQTRDVKDEIRGFQSDNAARLQGTDQALAHLTGELKDLKEQDLPAFRREFATVLATKFDMMEATVRDRQEALRSEIDKRMDSEQKRNSRIFLLLGLLTVLSVAVQVSAYVLTHPSLIP